MDWVKSMTDYYRDIAVASGTDAMEVMFKRGNALAGEIEQHGFIPDVMVPSLSRRPAQAKKVADQLVKAGLWERVRGGYHVVNFERINDELEKLVAKKKRDRDRKRAERSASRATSEDVSTDSPATGPEDRLYAESKSKKKTAAAAAGGAAAAAALPGPIDVLRAKLQAYTPLRALRFDNLAPETTSRLLELIDLHGDDPLVRVAIDTCRNPPPVHAGAFLGTWEALPVPGTRHLGVVTTRRCDVHGTTLNARGDCSSCAADQKAGNA